MKKQGYILRYYLPVRPHFDEEYTEKRFCELIDFCKKTKIESVMLYVALDPNWYYISDTPAYSIACRDQMLPYIKRLREAGISYQLNFQNLVGSTLGGVDFSKNFTWENLVDHKGRESLGCGCPIDENFRKEAGERLRIWAETEPDVIWIDDDLRYHNHGTPILAKLEGEGNYKDYYCFCKAHINRFNKENGTSFDRKFLIDAMTVKGEPSKTRKKYLDFLNDTICETAQWIHNTVKSASRNTRLAQMTSSPDVHSAEGREWGRFLSSLCGDDMPIVRSTFGPYKENDPRDFIDCYRKLAQTTVNIDSSCDTSVEFCPEIENTRFTIWSKSASATAYQLALSAFMGNERITLSLYDLDGGALSDEPLYEKMLIENKKYLDKLVSLELRNCSYEGVVIPTSPKSGKTYRLSDGDDYESLGGKNRYFEKYFLKMGVPCRYSIPDDIEDGVVILDGYSVGFLSDEQLEDMLSGKAIIDASATKTILERGFGGLIGVNGMTLQKKFVNIEIIHSFEREDKTHIRIPSRIPRERWYSLDVSDGVKLLSEFSAPDGDKYAGLTYFENSKGGKVSVYPAFFDLGDGFFTHHRVTLFKNLIEEMSPEIPRVECASYMLSVVKKGKDGKRYYFVANLCADKLEHIYINGKKVECNLNIYETAVFIETDENTVESI